MTLHRREFIAAAAGLLTSSAAHRLRAAPLPGVIDCHTHFYDPARPQGVPWPKPGTPLYRTVLPAHFRALAEPLGVTGTVVVEASSWVEDNQWLLDIAEREPFIVGIVGNLVPGTPEFPAHLNRFARNKLFRGIRVNGKALTDRITDAAFVDDLRRLADADLSVDLNGNAAMLPAVAQLARLVPTLRIILDHVAGPRPREPDPRPADDWTNGMTAAAAHPRVYCKVSALAEQSGSPDGQAPTDIAHYAPILDHVWHLFGADRVIYGSNWPVSDRGAPLSAIHKLATDFITPKGPAARDKFFATNARAAYKWLTR